MRADPQIWIKLKPLETPQKLDRTQFEALKEHLLTLSEAGIDYVSGHEKNWAEKVGAPWRWLEGPYEAVETSHFAITGILVFAQCMRNAHGRGPSHVEFIKTHVAALIHAGIAVGGGEHSVQVIFSTAEAFYAWADNPPSAYPRRPFQSAFSAYPKEN